MLVGNNFQLSDCLLATPLTPQGWYTVVIGLAPAQLNGLGRAARLWLASQPSPLNEWFSYSTHCGLGWLYMREWSPWAVNFQTCSLGEATLLLWLSVGSAEIRPGNFLLTLNTLPRTQATRWKGGVLTYFLNITFSSCTCCTCSYNRNQNSSAKCISNCIVLKWY